MEGPFPSRDRAEFGPKFLPVVKRPRWVAVAIKEIARVACGKRPSVYREHLFHRQWSAYSLSQSIHDPHHGLVRWFVSSLKHPLELPLADSGILRETGIEAPAVAWDVAKDGGQTITGHVGIRW